jgi:hypothetical protein
LLLVRAPPPSRDASGPAAAHSSDLAATIVGDVPTARLAERLLELDGVPVPLGLGLPRRQHARTLW